jgi:hypothetical protein
MLLTYYVNNNLANQFQHISLKYLATEDSFRTISFRLGHPTAQGIIQDVRKSIIKHLKREVMPTPNRTTWSKIVNDFWDLWNFLIALMPSTENTWRFIPLQTVVPSFSITTKVFLLALVDARYKFTVVDIGSYGRNSDGGIFTHSKLGKYLKTYLGILEDTQIPGHVTLSPSCYCGWRGLSSEYLLNETLPRIAKQRGQWEEHIHLLTFLSQESGGKCIWNIKPEISNLSEDPTITAGECGQNYFCDSYFA